MNVILVAQVPPTPTPLPPGEPVIELGNTYSLWSGTDAMIHTWNFLGTSGQVIQVIILITFVVAAVFLLVKFIQQFTRRDAEI